MFVPTLGLSLFVGAGTAASPDGAPLTMCNAVFAADDVRSSDETCPPPLPGSRVEHLLARKGTSLAVARASDGFVVIRYGRDASGAIANPTLAGRVAYDDPAVPEEIAYFVHHPSAPTVGLVTLVTPADGLPRTFLRSVPLDGGAARVLSRDGVPAAVWPLADGTFTLRNTDTTQPAPLMRVGGASPVTIAPASSFEDYLGHDLLRVEVPGATWVLDARDGRVTPLAVTFGMESLASVRALPDRSLVYKEPEPDAACGAELATWRRLTPPYAGPPVTVAESVATGWVDDAIWVAQNPRPSWWARTVLDPEGRREAELSCAADLPPGWAEADLSRIDPTTGARSAEGCVATARYGGFVSRCPDMEATKARLATLVLPPPERCPTLSEPAEVCRIALTLGDTASLARCPGAGETPDLGSHSILGYARNIQLREWLLDGVVRDPRREESVRGKVATVRYVDGAAAMELAFAKEGCTWRFEEVSLTPAR